MRREILLIPALFLLTLGCLSGPLPEDIPASTQATTLPTTTPPPSIESLNYISFDTVPSPDIDPEISSMVPEIEGLRLVPYANPVDVVGNDLQVLNHPRRLQILASIEDRQTFLYVKPDQETDTLIYYSIYRMDSSDTALEILEAYKSQWNKRPLNLSNLNIWVWDGYVDELEGRSRPFSDASVLYWDLQGNTSFLLDRVLPSHPTLTRAISTLYSVHGEASFGRYFIMMDIKTVLPDIENRTERIFSEMAEAITGGAGEAVDESPETPAPDEEEPPATMTDAEGVKETLRTLLEDYLAGEISKEEYDKLFQEYTAELENTAAEQ